MNASASSTRRDLLIGIGVTAIAAIILRQFCNAEKSARETDILLRAILTYKAVAMIALIVPKVEVANLHLEAAFHSIFKKRGRPLNQGRFYDSLAVADLILTELDRRGVASFRRHRRHSGSVSDALSLFDKNQWPRLRREVARLRC